MKYLNKVQTLRLDSQQLEFEFGLSRFRAPTCAATVSIMEQRCSAHSLDSSATPATPPHKFRFVSVYQVWEECPFPASTDVLSTSIGVLNSLGNASGVPVATMQREWRLYKQDTTALENMDQFDELGFSVLCVGQKPGAAASKLRRDVCHFIESHGSAAQIHVVLLIVPSVQPFRDVVQTLSRAGVFAFYVSNEAGEQADPRCLGAWGSLVQTAEHAAHRLPAAVNIDTQSSLDPALVDSAISEVVSSEGVRSGPSSSTPQKSTVSRLSSLSTWNGGGSKSQSCPSTQTLDGVVPQPGTTTAQQPKLLAPSKCRKVSAPETYDRSVAEHHATSRTDDNPPCGAAHKPADSHFASQPLSQATVGKSSSADGPGCVAAAAGTAAADPYRIITADIVRTDDDAYLLRTLSETVPFTLEDLEFNYRWLPDLLIQPQGHSSAPHASDPNDGAANPVQGTPVSCRLHKSKRITDIRLIGCVDRVVSDSYGFIEHPLFPDNLYFRFADLDNGNPSSSDTDSAPPIKPGAIVAFRIGRKGRRVWALRVWQVPPSSTVTVQRQLKYAPPQQPRGMASKHSRFGNNHPGARIPRGRRNGSSRGGARGAHGGSSGGGGGGGGWHRASYPRPGDNWGVQRVARQQRGAAHHQHHHRDTDFNGASEKLFEAYVRRSPSPSTVL